MPRSAPLALLIVATDRLESYLKREGTPKTLIVWIVRGLIASGAATRDPTSRSRRVTF